jgi:hypothetical protein
LLAAQRLTGGFAVDNWEFLIISLFVVAVLVLGGCGQHIIYQDHRHAVPNFRCTGGECIEIAP